MKFCEDVSIGNKRNCPIKYCVGKTLTFLSLYYITEYVCILL